MSRASIRRGAGSVLVAAFAAACQDGTGPQAGSFDAARVSSGTATVHAVAQSPAVGSLGQLARLTGGMSLSASGMAADGSAGDPSRALAADADRIARASIAGGINLLPVLRNDQLGRTYEYDPSKGRYAVSTRSGAPANGVRFTLYAEDEKGRPIVGREVGYADLTDEKRNVANTLGVRLVIVLSGVTRLSYAFDVVQGATTTFDVSGYLTDGRDRLDFSVTASGITASGTLASVTTKLSVPGSGFAVESKLTGAIDAEGGTVDMTITSERDRIVVRATVAPGALDATFTVNGTLFARATGSLESPTITGADGKALAPDALDALGAIVHMADDVHELAAELVEPAIGLLAFAIGLGA